MKTKDFKYHPLRYYREDHDELATEICKDYEGNSLKQLTEFYDNIKSRDDIPQEEKTLRLRIIRLYLAWKLDFVERDRFDYLVETVAGELYQLELDLEKLQNHFKNHRHSTDKTYGEKPVW